MGIAGKKYREAKEKVEKEDFKSWREAVTAVIKTAHAKFDESVDTDIVLSIDASKGEQTVRGSVMLPHGTGKKIRVLVFAKGEHEEQAKAAGADYVGFTDLIEKISGGWMEFDVAVATPDLMGQIGKVAKILGPRGLLPNKKFGTVTLDVANIVSDLKKGRLSYRNDKGGCIHAPFGKVSFGEEKLCENLVSLIKSVSSNKPSSAKGKFIKKIIISSTMGVGISLDQDEILK
jgi:large subunit ribosomal protein L1